MAKRFEKRAQRAVILTTSPYKNELKRKKEKQLKAEIDKAARLKKGEEKKMKKRPGVLQKSPKNCLKT